jgi:hypothetical protein
LRAESADDVSSAFDAADDHGGAGGILSKLKGEYMAYGLNDQELMDGLPVLGILSRRAERGWHC